MILKDIMKSPAFWIFISFIAIAFIVPFPYNILSLAISPMPIIMKYIIELLRRRGITATIDEDLLYLVTHMYSASTGRPPHEKLFMLNNISGKGYGVYSLTLNRIANLAKRWGYGFAIATKIQAKKVFNPIFRDFLIRLSEAINVGEDLEKFLLMEQQTMIVSYEADYARVLEATRILLGIYSASISSALFINVNLMLIAVLFFGGIITILASFIGTCLALASLVYLIRRSLPKQDITHDMKINMPERRLYIYSLLASIIIASIVSILIINIYRNPSYFLISFGIFMIIPGIIGRRIENKIRNIESFFTVFIRSLGLAFATLRNYAESLKSILRTDFGELTKHLRRLYSRLRNGVDRNVAMYFFIGETGSECVRRGMDIFYDAIEAGGDPSKVGEVLSITIQKLINLRKQREQIARAFQGVIYILHILTVALAELVFTLVILFQQLLQAMGTMPIEILPTSYIDPNIITIVKMLLIFIITMLNALAIQFAKGGFTGSVWMHVSILSILSGATMIFASALSQSLFKLLNIRELFTEMPTT